MENENSTKELDLIDIIKICWNWFVSYIWTAVVFLVKFLLRKWWVLILGVLAGLAVSYIYSTYFPRYVGHIIFKNNVCSSSDFVSDVRMMTNTSAAVKMEKFNLSASKAGAIYAIWAHQLCFLDSIHSNYVVDESDNLAAKGKLCVWNMFDVEILAGDLAVFDSIQDALLYYFNNSEYYQQQNVARFKRFNLQVADLGEEIDKLDLTRNQGGAYVGAIIGPDGSDDMSAVVNPAIISKEIIRMRNESISFEEQLAFSADIVSVVAPVRYNIVPKNSYVYTWKKCVVLSVLLCYALALLITYRRKIYDFIKG